MNNIATYEKWHGTICDAHIHIGRFLEGNYYSPKMVAEYASFLGIKSFVVSSMSGTDGDLDVVIEELQSLRQSNSIEIIPLFWVIPSMLKNLRSRLVSSNELFKGFKIHPFSEKWGENDKRLFCVFSLADELSYPVLMHTGWTPESNACRFLELYKRFPQVKIVLAHGRPLDETIHVAKTCKNIWLDISYMTTDDIAEFVDACGPDRILFGTDFPIDRYYYPNEDVVDRYKQRVNDLVELFGIDIFNAWCSSNFATVYQGK